MAKKQGRSKAEQSHTIKRLLAYLKPYQQTLWLTIVMTVLVTLISIASPIVMGEVLSYLQRVLTQGEAIDFRHILNLALILAGMYLLSSGAEIVSERSLVQLSQSLIRDMREDVSQKIRRIPLSYFDQHQTGDVLSRMINDIDTVGRNIQLSVSKIFSSLLLVLGIILMMLWLSPVLSAVFFLTIPLNFLATRFITHRSRRYFRAKSKDLGQMVGFVEENFTGTDLIKAYGHEEQSAKDFQAINDALYEVSYKASFMGGILLPIMTFIGNLAYVFIAIVGGFLVIQQRILIGDVLAFIQYSQTIRRPLDIIADMANTLQETLASAYRVFALLDAPEEAERQEARLDGAIQSIEFNHVSFAYEADQPVIQDFNLKVEQGETIAIVGHTGAGKTTLVNLLLRFYDVSRGSITINGVDIRDVSRDTLRQRFGMVLQETWLIQGSIADNIRYGKEDATDEEVVLAAKAAHAHRFIQTLPDGYATILNEDATNISQGQRQLLTIARAFVSDPDILVLDEATSSVDTRTEQLIQEGMNNLMQGRTNFVIAHRLSTIVGADTILVMEAGNVVEQGSHEELMDRKGHYYDLYQSQFMGEAI